MGLFLTALRGFLEPVSLLKRLSNLRLMNLLAGASCMPVLDAGLQGIQVCHYRCCAKIVNLHVSFIQRTPHPL